MGRADYSRRLQSVSELGASFTGDTPWDVRCISRVTLAPYVLDMTNPPNVSRAPTNLTDKTENKL